MAYEITPDPEVEILTLNKQSGFKYRERRHEDWRENYTLYRDKVRYNRLTQRQTVNLPLMKTTIKTMLKDTDDITNIEFENLDNDKQKELYINEYWNKTLELNKSEIKDIVDKKQEFLFGRTADHWQAEDGYICWKNTDIEDILVDRFTDPTDLNTARFLIHINIFKPLSYLENNKDFDQAKVKELKQWFASEQGIVKNQTNLDAYHQKQQKMTDMGLDDAEDPILGETVVQLSNHLVMKKKDGSDKEEYHLIVEAEDMKILMDKPLDEVYGKTGDDHWKTHLPYHSWADDVEIQDFWSDGNGDVVRVPNQLMNTWFSQGVENRTLRNLNMNIYNSNVEGFVPQNWTAQPWGMYPVPVPAGMNLKDVFQPLPVADLTGDLTEMQYVETMMSKATGATATQEGITQGGQITLGEVKLALGEAKEKIKGISKFYTQVWKDRALTFLKIIEGRPELLDELTIHKKGLNSNDVYSMDIGPKHFQTMSGYSFKVWSQAEKSANDSQDLERLAVAAGRMINNPKVQDLFNTRLLEFSKIKPDIIAEIMEIEQAAREQMQAQNQMLMQQNLQIGKPPAPQLPVSQPPNA